MHETEATLSGTWRNQAKALVGDVVRAVQLRRELAELEVWHDVRAARRLAFVGGVGALLVVTGLPVYVICAVHSLAAHTSLGFIGWALILASLLVVPGMITLAVAVARFRSDFSGLRRTLTELNEDMVWLREWVERQEGADTADSDHDRTADDQ